MGCPICDGELTVTMSRYKYYDIDLGEFNAEVCQRCGEVFFTEESSDEIDRIAKIKGIWGLERRSKISYSGNSIIVRIPKDIAEFMELQKGKEILIHTEGKKRLVVDIP